MDARWEDGKMDGWMDEWMNGLLEKAYGSYLIISFRGCVLKCRVRHRQAEYIHPYLFPRKHNSFSHSKLQVSRTYIHISTLSIRSGTPSTAI